MLEIRPGSNGRDDGLTKVLGVSASRRIWGNCEIATKLALLAARDAGAGTAFLRLADLRIEQCRGCFECVSDKERCALGDDLDRLIEAADGADALVLASPVYFGLPPACVIALLDRLLVRTPGKGQGASSVCAKPAATVTVMGNRKWRGIAEPVLNLTSSLLGFQLLESLSVVAEGPGEILSDEKAIQSVISAGRRVASITEASITGSAVGSGRQRVGPADVGPAASASQGRCPTCRSDFFRIGEGGIECPICGERGELEPYLREGTFVASGGERRWGRSWLGAHVASWIKPSVERYRSKRRDILRNVSELKRRYSAIEGGE